MGKNPSYLWKNIIWGRALLNRGIKKRIGNGVDTSMFNDPWLSKELTFKPICINRDMSNSKVADFLLPTGNWDEQKLRESVLDTDCELIRGIPTNKNLKDKLIWHYDRTGVYTVKSGYKLFMKTKINGISSSSNPMTKT